MFPVSFFFPGEIGLRLAVSTYAMESQRREGAEVRSDPLVNTSRRAVVLPLALGASGGYYTPGPPVWHGGVRGRGGGAAGRQLQMEANIRRKRKGDL